MSPALCRFAGHVTAKGEPRLQRQWPGSRTAAVTCPQVGQEEGIWDYGTLGYIVS